MVTAVTTNCDILPSSTKIPLTALTLAMHGWSVMTIVGGGGGGGVKKKKIKNNFGGWKKKKMKKEFCLVERKFKLFLVLFRS